MENFIKLNYDTQWLLIYFHYKKELTLRKKIFRTDQSEAPITTWDFSPYFKDFCKATKNSMDFNSYDEKMMKLGDIVDFLLQEEILTLEDAYTDGSNTIKISDKGNAYYELEIENKLLSVLPKIDFNDSWEKFTRTKDATDNYIFSYTISEYKDTEKTAILKSLKSILINSSNFTLEKLFPLIMKDPDLTKSIIEYIVKLLNG